MKRILLFLVVGFLLAVSFTASAYPVQVDDYIRLGSGDYNTTTRAGEFTFSVYDSNKKDTDIDVSTFCLEPSEIIYFNRDYQITELKEGSGTAVTGTDAWNQIAWLYWSYDQGTLAKYDDDKWSGLQYAFWTLVGQSQSASQYYNTAASDYINLALEAVTGGWANNGRVAVAVNRGQDILVANPVPEPATMLLLGSGLIGLAGFGRKKLLK